jgi:hypothetical protein
MNFGDNSTIALTGNPSGTYSTVVTHTYSATGTFSATLTSYNTITNCSSYSTYKVRVYGVKAVITRGSAPLPTLPAAIGCVGGNNVFTGAQSVDVDQDCGTDAFMWTMLVPGKPADAPSSTIPAGFPVAGIYTLTLKVKDPLSCVDDTTVFFRISETVPDFTFSAFPLCLADKTVQIINKSQAA